MRKWCKLVPMTFLALAAAAPAATQDEDVSPGRLREAMRSYFEDRLRSELALSDEQMADIEPRIRELEQARAEFRTKKAETVRGLARGIEQGAADAELAGGLERLEALDDEQRRLERRLRHEIDRTLSTRQRVELRFFLQRFQRDMAERMRELRDERGRWPAPALALLLEDPRQHLGRRGEELAAATLAAAGYRIVARRWRRAGAEIDVICEYRELVVFVEVKTRSGDGYGAPAEAVTRLKRRRMARAALSFLAARGWLDRPCRFDVVEVVRGRRGASGVHHVADAFRLEPDDCPGA
jgi:putative endonuclease